MQHSLVTAVMQCLMPSGDWRRFLDLRRWLLLASLIGFSLQTINMAMQYFHYHTSNQVDHRLFDRIIPAAVSLCFPLHSVRSRGRGSRSIITIPLQVTLTVPRRADYLLTAGPVQPLCPASPSPSTSVPHPRWTCTRQPRRA